MSEITEEYMQERARWYSHVPALFEIVKALKGHELSFLSSKKIPKELRKKAVRFLFCRQVDYLQKHFKWFNFLKTDLNVYMSVATLQNLPIFSYDIKNRLKDPNYIQFNEHYEDYVVGYDFFADFDGKEDYAKCCQEAKEFKKILDDFKVPYYVMPSSPHGFHFHIPAEFISKKPLESLQIINSVIFNLAGIYSWKTLDTGVIDIKRLCKAPYSFCEGAICLPLTDNQFDYFSLELVKVDFLLNCGTPLRDRGMLLRRHNLSDKELKANVLKFFSEYK
jgi:hypothetical protein